MTASCSGEWQPREAAVSQRRTAWAMAVGSSSSRPGTCQSRAPRGEHGPEVARRVRLEAAWCRALR